MNHKREAYVARDVEEDISENRNFPYKINDPVIEWLIFDASDSILRNWGLTIPIRRLASEIFLAATVDEEHKKALKPLLLAISGAGEEHVNLAMDSLGQLEMFLWLIVSQRSYYLEKLFFLKREKNL